MGQGSEDSDRFQSPPDLILVNLGIHTDMMELDIR